MPAICSRPGETDLRSRIPLIYILSSGRSGSTLLELLIGTSSQAWTVGEVQLVPWAFRTGALCGCQRTMSECPFWGPLCPEAQDVPGTVEDMQYFRRNLGNQGRVVRWRELASALGAPMSARETTAAGAYGKRCHRFLSQVLERHAAYRPAQEIRWLVDASKDPYRLRWLEASGLFDIRVVHLVKDPRAFVYSMCSKQADVRRMVRFTARWVVENAIAHALCTTSFPGRHIMVWYEDLAQEPMSVLLRVGAMTGLEFTASTVDTFRALESHGVAGNAMRGRSDPVRLDQRWRRGLSALQQRAIWAASTPTRVLLSGTT